MNRFDQDALNQKAVLFVRGLHPNQVTEAILESHFIPFGPIIQVVMPKPEPPAASDKDQARELPNPDEPKYPVHNKGYAFVQFEYPEDALAALSNMNNNELFERTINCSYAQSNQISLAPNSASSSQAAPASGQ